MGANGELIPQDVVEILGFASTSKMVLLIEKDATFQKLVQDPVLMSQAVLITAKGMPDLNTRWATLITFSKVYSDKWCLNSS